MDFSDAIALSISVGRSEGEMRQRHRDVQVDAEHKAAAKITGELLERQLDEIMAPVQAMAAEAMEIQAEAAGADQTSEAAAKKSFQRVSAFAIRFDMLANIAAMQAQDALVEAVNTNADNPYVAQIAGNLEARVKGLTDSYAGANAKILDVGAQVDATNQKREQFDAGASDRRSQRNLRRAQAEDLEAGRLEDRYQFDEQASDREAAAEANRALAGQRTARGEQIEDETARANEPPSEAEQSAEVLDIRERMAKVEKAEMELDEAGGTDPRAKARKALKERVEIASKIDEIVDEGTRESLLDEYQALERPEGTTSRDPVDPQAGTVVADEQKKIRVLNENITFLERKMSDWIRAHPQQGGMNLPSKKASDLRKQIQSDLKKFKATRTEIESRAGLREEASDARRLKGIHTRAGEM